MLLAALIMAMHSKRHVNLFSYATAKQQAGLIMTEVMKFLDVFKADERLDKLRWTFEEKIVYNKLTRTNITFKARPCADSIRGDQPDIMLIDELLHFARVDVFQSVLMPMMSVSGRVVFCKYNLFVSQHTYVRVNAVLSDTQARRPLRYPAPFLTTFCARR